MVKYSPRDVLPTAVISLKKWCTAEEFLSTNLVNLFTEARPISIKKYIDLQRLINYIPEKYHSFYRSLKHSDTEKINDTTVF